MRWQTVFRLDGPKGVIASATLILDAPTKEAAIVAGGLALDDLGLKRWALTWISEIDQ